MTNVNLEGLLTQIGELEKRLGDFAEKTKGSSRSTNKEIEELDNIVDDLKKTVVQLDKNFAVQEEKQVGLVVRMNQLEEIIKDMKGEDTKAEARKQAMAERIIMLVLGAAATYLFGLLK